jgi:hypothetical protein
LGLHDRLAFTREVRRNHGCAHSWRRCAPHRRFTLFSALLANIASFLLPTFSIQRGHPDNDQELMTFRPFDGTRARLVLSISQKALNILIANQKV